jgi:hypothetical protein
VQERVEEEQVELGCGSALVTAAREARRERKSIIRRGPVCVVKIEEEEVR